MAAIDVIGALPEFIGNRHGGDASTPLGNIDKLQTHIDSNERHLLNYGTRHPPGDRFAWLQAPAAHSQGKPPDSATPEDP